MADAQTPLQPMSQAPDELEMCKQSWKDNVYDIVGGDQAFARIDYAVWSGKARAESADGTWFFSRQKGIREPRIEISREGTDVPFARLNLELWHRGGTVELDGTAYRIDVDGHWKPEWNCSRDGRELFGLKQTGGFGKTKGNLQLTEAGREDANTALLLLVTMHAQYSHDQQSGAGAAAATST